MNQIRTDENGNVQVNQELYDECQAWNIDLHGLTPNAARAYLDRLLVTYQSNGEWCLYTRQDSGYDERPPGKCMCARLMGLLHEVREEAMNTAVFSRLQEIRSNALVE